MSVYVGDEGGGTIYFKEGLVSAVFPGGKLHTLEYIALGPIFCVVEFMT